MKKLLGFIWCLFMMVFSVTDVIAQEEILQTLETSPDSNSFPSTNQRREFYYLPGGFIRLVGGDIYQDWYLANRSYVGNNDESIALAFIRAFNISREDFERANEEAYLDFANSRWDWTRYPTNILFTFDNSLINYYYLHENTPLTRHFGSGMEHGRSRRSLFYNMPAAFGELVGRENFIIWRYHRSEYERANENIAVSFIRYFDVSREDFSRVNDEAQRMLTLDLRTEEASLRNFANRYLYSRFGGPLSRGEVAFLDIYPVDLIFSFDNEAINHFFLDESLPLWGYNPHLEFAWTYIGLDPEEMWIAHENQLDRNIRIRTSTNYIHIPFTDQQPVLTDGRTLVPLRVVMEHLGFTVDWQEAESLVTLTMGANHTIQVQIDNLTMQVNGIAVPLDVSPKLINGRTMVPVRAIAEATGFTVDWRWQDRIVDITF